MFAAMVRNRAIAIVGAIGALALVIGSTASAKVVWLCRPGSGGPCTQSLATTLVNAQGRSEVIHPRGARHPGIDCFYVYPTASSQQGFNAELRPDPGVISAVRSQASQFSRVCRLFVPLYRQITLRGLSYSPSQESRLLQIAYNSVVAAWEEYLRRFNHGRGVVLIGHSQGTTMLRHLISTRIDRRSSERRRLVSAILLGGNVLVPTGRRVGGDFKHVPACQSAHELACVIAYSSFETPPPEDALFGLPSSHPKAQYPPPSGHGRGVLCTNPAALAGGAGPLLPSFTVNHAAGLLGSLGTVPGIQTPWLSYPHLYQARCRHRGNATWLQITDVAPSSDKRVRVSQTLGPAWGLHLQDVNLAIGNLLSILQQQTRAYEQEHPSR